jgi:ferredoxin
VRVVKLPPERTSYWFPTFAPAPGGRRSLFSPGELQGPGGPTPSSCLACLDTPCRLFTSEEVAGPVSVDTPVYPDTSVCPVDAVIMIGSTGIPQIDEGVCIGCGLCAARCPVGAIHLDRRTAVARVTGPEQGDYEPRELTREEFAVERAHLSATLSSELAPFADAALVSGQIARFNEHMMKDEEQRTFRLLARNAFLTLGCAARLKNPGDNNAFAELVVDAESTLVLLEVETGRDMLDAFRRSLSGVAIAISRYGLPHSQVVAGIVVDRLPNVRVDYYEAVKNAASRTGFVLRSLPIAVLLLGIRSGDDRLVRFVLDEAVVDSDHRSLQAAVDQIWGVAPTAGLSPVK